eukprot:197184-Rhodomonas_salina.1
MCAANQQVSLDTQAPSLAKSDIWDPNLASMSLEQNSAPTVDVDDGEQNCDALRRMAGAATSLTLTHPPPNLDHQYLTRLRVQ